MQKHTRNADATLYCPECGDPNGIPKMDNPRFPWRPVNVYICGQCKRYFVAILILIMARRCPVQMSWKTLPAFQTEVKSLGARVINEGHDPTDEEILHCIDWAWMGD